MLTGKLIFCKKIPKEFLLPFFMVGILLAFLYPHFSVLQDRHLAHAFSEMLIHKVNLLAVGLSLSVIAFVVLKYCLKIKPTRTTLYHLWLLFVVASFMAFNMDIYAIYELSRGYGFAFTEGLSGYWQHTAFSYSILWLSGWSIIAFGWLTEGRHKPLFGYDFMKKFGVVISLFLPATYLAPPLLYAALKQEFFLLDAKGFLFSGHVLWLLQSMVFMAALLRGLKQGEINRGFLSQQLKVILVISGLLFAAELMICFRYCLHVTRGNSWPYHESYSWVVSCYGFMSLVWPLILQAVLSFCFWRYHRGKSKLGEDEEKISNDFGSARFATREDLKNASFYDEHQGPLFGQDAEGHNLYTPLVNKLIISPPGGGKTTSSSIPLLLQHDGPAFVFDVKGELWAVTAQHRQERMNRQVIAIDPFNITRQKSFSEGKSEALLKPYHINPFDWLPSEPRALDRVMNAFASSFLITSDMHTSHFDDNAKILIRGYIDYLARSKEVMRSLPELFRLLSGSFEDNQEILEKMVALGGRAMAAANQISRVGSNERGSILSTTYRQIDWLGDSNLNELLSNSNFNLKDFLKGNMDIFVIVPEDQIKEHGRLMRMMMALLMGQIIQADPSDLPDKKMVFLLEELAQMGNYPDVELCIEVLRARNVVVWSVFQTLGQIELFEKPDLFKSATLKQIFTTDDVDTMQWIQALAGKKTILTKGKSEGTGKSRQPNQWFVGSTSSNKGESIHETGVDLLPTNEIREMNKDMQLVFYHGLPVIRCKKALYFKDEKLKSLASDNPLA